MRVLVLLILLAVLGIGGYFVIQDRQDRALIAAARSKAMAELLAEAERLAATVIDVGNTPDWAIGVRFADGIDLVQLMPIDGEGTPWHKWSRLPPDEQKLYSSEWVRASGRLVLIAGNEAKLKAADAGKAAYLAGAYR